MSDSILDLESSTESTTSGESLGSTDPASPPVGGGSDSFKDFKDKDGLILGKYKTPEDALNGYKSLSTEYRTLQASIPKAPENYEEFKFEGEEFGGLSIDSKSPTVAGVLDVLKENNISQDVAQKIFDAYLKNAVSTDKSELQALKDKVPSEVTSSLSQFGKKLNEEDQKILQEFCSTPESMNFLHRHLVPRQQTVPGTLPLSTGMKSSHEYFEEAFKLREATGFSLDEAGISRYEQLTALGAQAFRVEQKE